MKYLCFIAFIAFSFTSYSQTQQYQHWEWAKSYGGSGNDSTKDMKVKRGFLYVTGNFTSPQVNWNNTILTNKGGQDILVAKLDTNGNTIWVKSFGGVNDENALQLEINSTGAMVIRCQSASPSVNVAGNTLVNPTNFYMVLDINGNVLNSVVLPAGPVYPDIDIDNDRGIYVSASYQHPFAFGGKYVDSSYGLAGAALLKYTSQGVQDWYKNVQVRSNNQYEWIEYDNNPPFDSYTHNTPAVTGDANAALQLEFNEQDYTIEAICEYKINAKLDNLYLDGGYETFDWHHGNIHLKVSPSGAGRLSNFFPDYDGSFGTYCTEFKTGASGFNYTSTSHQTLNELYYYITSINNGRVVKSKISFVSAPFQIDSSAANPPFETNETGNFLIGNSPSSPTVVVLDTALNQILTAAVTEFNRIPLQIKGMASTNAIFFSSSFSGEPLKINESLPGGAYTLSGEGSGDIFIGKFLTAGVALPALTSNKTSYKTCKPADTIQLDLTSNEPYGAKPYTYRWQASSHFSDTNILSPKVFVGTDSIVNQLTITNANGVKYLKEFVFFSGKSSDLKLVAENMNVCGNDTVRLSIQGAKFEQVFVYQEPWQNGFQDNDFNTPDKIVKYVPGGDHMVSLIRNYESIEVSPYCINSVPIDIKVRQAFVDKKDVFVCRGSSYNFASGNTVNNIQQNIADTIRFNRTNGCDSSYITNLIVSPVYSTTREALVCSGGDYYLPNQTILSNITRDTSYTLRYSSIFGCDSIINFNIHPVLPPKTTVDVSVCKGSNYGYKYYNSLDTIRNIISDTAVTLQYISYLFCDSTVTIKIKVALPSETTQNITLCKGSNYTFPDQTVQNNLTANLSHTSRLTSIAGCDSTIHINIIVSNIVVDTSVTQNITELRSNSDLSTYQWLDCTTGTPINAATGQSYTATSAGMYAVAVTKESCTDTSSCYIITSPDLLTGGRQLVPVFPVPAKDHFTFEVTADKPVVLNITLLNFTGSPVRSEKVNLVFGKNTITQNIANLPAGVYTLVLQKQDSSDVIIKRITKL